MGGWTISSINISPSKSKQINHSLQNFSDKTPLLTKFHILNYSQIPQKHNLFSNNSIQIPLNVRNSSTQTIWTGFSQTSMQICALHFPNENAHRDENRLLSAHPPSLPLITFGSYFARLLMIRVLRTVGMATVPYCRRYFAGGAYYESPESKLMTFEIRRVCNLC